jgi:hypothetical protein
VRYQELQCCTPDERLAEVQGQLLRRCRAGGWQGLAGGCWPAHLCRPCPPGRTSRPWPRSCSRRPSLARRTARESRAVGGSRKPCRRWPLALERDSSRAAERPHRTQCRELLPPVLCERAGRRVRRLTELRNPAAAAARPREGGAGAESHYCLWCVPCARCKLLAASSGADGCPRWQRGSVLGRERGRACC